MFGSSGVIECYDVEQRRKFDYSSPNDMTSTWEAIAVTGDKGSEKVLAANGSGKILPFTVDGFDVNWGRLRRPVSGGADADTTESGTRSRARCSTDAYGAPVRIVSQDSCPAAAE